MCSQKSFARVFNDLRERTQKANRQVNDTIGRARLTNPEQVQPGQPYTPAATGGNYGALTQTVSNTMGSGTNRQFQLALRFNL